MQLKFRQHIYHEFALKCVPEFSYQVMSIFLYLKLPIGSDKSHENLKYAIDTILHDLTLSTFKQQTHYMENSIFYLLVVLLFSISQ